MIAASINVVSPEDRAQLEAIAAELQQAELNPLRRSELLETASKIAEKYSCDARLCD